jgi:hypothetical protein
MTTERPPVMKCGEWRHQEQSVWRRSCKSAAGYECGGAAVRQYDGKWRAVISTYGGVWSASSPDLRSLERAQKWADRKLPRIPRDACTLVDARYGRYGA